MVTMEGMDMRATHWACGSSLGMMREMSVRRPVARRDMSSISLMAKAWEEEG